MMVQEGMVKSNMSRNKGKGKGTNEFKPNTSGLKPTGGVSKDSNCFHYGQTGQ